MWPWVSLNQKASDVVMVNSVTVPLRLISHGYSVTWPMTISHDPTDQETIAHGAGQCGKPNLLLHHGVKKKTTHNHSQ
jgi:hypothetical protein